jgi:uncharacterized protein
MPASTDDHPVPVRTVIEAFFAALESGDIDAMDALYAEDLVVWTNLTKADAARAPSLKLVAWLSRKVQNLHYEIIARHDITLPDGSEGLVQQHVLTGRAPDGTELRAPACLVIAVRNGKITRIDEYLNGADVESLSR